MILLNGMPIHWRSNKQPITSISSAQAEIYAMSEAVRDSRLRLWVHEELGGTVTYPFHVLVDNSESFKQFIKKYLDYNIQESYLQHF